MHITSDNFSVFTAVAFSALSAVSYAIAGAVPGSRFFSRLIGLGRFCCSGAAASFSYAALYLLSQILSGMRYDLNYVFMHTGPGDPLLYRFSALWAGQEGSLLLWVCMCAWIAVWLAGKTRDRLPLALAAWSLVIVSLAYVLIITDPFAKMAEFRLGMVGSGLNPLLRNPWIAIHPPIIFVGYAALMVPAAFAADALLRSKYDQWISRSLPWLVFGWVSLGAGIAMGMVWSYEVLGWGGYWGWDPVENASLVPWLLGIALIHGMLVQRRTGGLVRANRILSMGLFLSIVYAAFLTRSGVLSELSVHSFTDGGAFAYWRSLLAGFAVLCVGMPIVRWKDAGSDREPKRIGAADKLVMLGIVGIVLFAIAVIVGTSLPLIVDLVAKPDQQEMTKYVIRPQFYNRMAAPIALLIVALTAAVTIARRKLSLAANLAHAGIAIMLIGVVFSSGAESRTVSLTKGGRSKSAFGYDLAYYGRMPGGAGRELAMFKAKRGRRTFAAPVVMEYTEHQAVRFPYVRPGLFSDLYVSPVEIGNKIITPTASVTDEGWLSLPVQIPGVKATLTMVGMQVEQDMAKLRYQTADGYPTDIEAFKGKPVTVDGCVFEVRRLLVESSKDMSSITAGADVAVSGPSVPDVAVIQVSIKPLVSMVWLGLVMMTLGGSIATIRRFRESNRSKA